MEPSHEAPPIHDPVEPVREYVPLERIPFPLYVKILAAVTAVAFVLSLVRLPHSLKQGIQHERGTKLIAAGKPAQAVPLLEGISAEYPSNRDLKLDLAEAYAYAGMFPQAVRELMAFEGTMVTDEQEKRLNQLEAYIDSKIPAEEPKR